MYHLLLAWRQQLRVTWTVVIQHCSQVDLSQFAWNGNIVIYQNGNIVIQKPKWFQYCHPPKWFQKATCQAAADFLPEKLHCCEGLATLHWNRCQCRCHRFLTRVLQGENPPLRWSLSTRTWGAGVPASWWHQAPGSHDRTMREQKYFRVDHRAVSRSTSYNSVEAKGGQIWQL